MNPRHVIIIGPGYPLRGGLATFDQRLAKEFLDLGDDCKIYSFSLQYPSFLFPGTSQFSTDPAPQGIPIFSKINSISPLNWLSVGAELRNLAPDIVVVRYWIPFMGPALGTILRKIRRNQHSKIVAITDNILPHEKRPGDRAFTKYFLRSCDAFITMSEKVLFDLRTLEPSKPAVQVLHPLYDNFGEALPKSEARKWLVEQGIGVYPSDKLLLFFGFIRKYKGLDILLRAMANSAIRDSGIKLLVAGEFYEDAQYYLDLVSSLRLDNCLLLKTDFIPDSEVKFYLSSCDAVVQPYRSATQSGVTPLAYQFEKPMIVTNVGGLPSLVADGKAGLVCEPDPDAMAHALLRFYELGENYFIPHLRSEKTKYSWKTLVNTITELAHDIPK